MYADDVLEQVSDEEMEDDRGRGRGQRGDAIGDDEPPLEGYER